MTLTFHLIPHVHWDREWYQTRHGFLTRLVPMLDRVLDQLDANPSLRFHLDGQTIVAEEYLAVAPERRDRLRAAVRRGQLALGPWYVLADELIPRGTSLRKNLELGIASAQALGGSSQVLYSPDAFGHPAGLPDLGAEFGLRWAVLWRGLGLVGGRGRDLYRWVGPLGGSLLVYHLPPEGYEVGIDLVAAGAELPKTWRALRSRMLGRAVCSHVAVPIGADHHTPTPDLPRLAERIAALETDAEVRFSGYDEYFRAVDRAAPAVDTIEGEQRRSLGYVWSLQGVHSTRARMKRQHSRAEAMLIDVVEPLQASLAGPRSALLDEAWRLLVQSQFHDTIAGCTIDGAAREQQVRLEAVTTIADQLATEALDRLSGHDSNRVRREPASARPTLLLWSPDPYPFGGVVIARTTWFKRDVLVGPPGVRIPMTGPGYLPFHLLAADGTKLAVQILRVAEAAERRDASEHYPDLDLVDEVWVAFRIDGLPSREPVVLEAVPGVAAFTSTSDPVQVDPRLLRNDTLEVVVDGDGRFSVQDLHTGRMVAGLGAVELEPDRGDLYTPELDTTTLRVAQVSAPRVVASGPLFGAIELAWRVESSSGGLVCGRTVLSLRAGDPILRIDLEFDNHAADIRLRFRLPLEMRGQIVVGSPLGEVRRAAAGADRSWSEETGLPTAPAHDFVCSVGGSGAGFAVSLSGFFEYELQHRGDLLITLLRAVGVLSRDDLSTRVGHAAWTVPTPEAVEPGRHLVTMAIGTAVAPRLPVTRWLRGPLP